MKKMFQNWEQRNCSNKTSEAGSLGTGRPASAAGSLADSLTLKEWRAETIRLREGVCWCNPWRGIPTGWQFEQLYREGHSPEAALTLWRDWEPWDEYTPPHDESWPPHDYD